MGRKTLGNVMGPPALINGHNVLTITGGSYMSFVVDDETGVAVIDLKTVLPVNMGGTGNASGQAPSASKLAAMRNLKVDLAESNSAQFDGTGDATSIGVGGVLPVANGGTGNASGLAPAASKLNVARKLSTNLASEAAADFDGSADAAGGVSGVLPVAHGGTGSTTGQAPTAAKLATPHSITVDLTSDDAGNFDGSADATTGVSGILPVAHGGTGTNNGLSPLATKLNTARNITVNLESGNAASFDGAADVTPGVSGILPMAHGGLGVTTAADARTVLGAAASGHNHDTTYLKQALLGIAGGVAPLDTSGKIDAAYLPSYVDDVIEGTVNNGLTSFTETDAAAPLTPEKGKIYLDINKNIGYRWSGSRYVAMSSDLALGETETTAYRGDRGAAAYSHSRQDHAPADANKTEASTTNGKIKIAGVDVTVYTHPTVSVTTDSSATDTFTPGQSYTVLTDVTVDGTGHTTKKTTKTFTMPGSGGAIGVANGGTGATTAAGARTNLGLVNIQSGSTQPTNQAAGDYWLQTLS